jgi:acyl-CoA reductase-like NAD-dependent aldehyde dehydrogenase
MEAREALLARVSTADGATEIKDPATGEVIGRHTFGTPEDVKQAVDKAAAAQPAWAALTDEERVGYLNRAADNIEAHAEELAYAIVREQGKTISGIGASVGTRQRASPPALRPARSGSTATAASTR